MHVVTNPARVTRRQLESLCSVGMVLGASFFAASLTPTLIPRSYLTQGAAALLFWSIANNLLIRTAFRALDLSFREYDALLEPERPQPTAPGKTGSSASGQKKRAARTRPGIVPTLIGEDSVVVQLQ